LSLFDGTSPFNASALAKTAQGTPFKRPENGQFRPGSDFKQFFFDETGDTNALRAPAGLSSFQAPPGDQNSSRFPSCASLSRVQRRRGFGLHHSFRL